MTFRKEIRDRVLGISSLNKANLEAIEVNKNTINDIKNTFSKDIKSLRDDIFGEKSKGSWYGSIIDLLGESRKKDSIMDRIDNVESKLNLLIEHLGLEKFDERVKGFRDKKEDVIEDIEE